MFGSYAVIEPVEHRFKKSPELFWKIKPITSGDELALEMWLDANKRAFVLPNGEHTYIAPIWIRIMHRQIALTFAGTNIAYPDGKPFIQDNPTPEQVEAALLKMPEEMVEEVWFAVRDANPTWGPRSTAAEPETEEASLSTEQ